MTQLEVWQAGGPSNTTLTTIEAGNLKTLTRKTARNLDEGLQWQPGSAKAVFERGEKPTPAHPHGLDRKEAAWLREQIAAADVDAGTRERLLRVLDEERGSA